jgi:cytidine deaminase
LKVSTEFHQLISSARGLVGKFDLGNDSKAGSVAAALKTEAGNIYTGICLQLECGIGFCAEHSAVAEMLKHRERVITEIVAINKKRILPPCGRCRELIAQVAPANRYTKVILSESQSIFMHELLPHHWLAFGGDV